MRRRHFFEFEDQAWFPSLIREYMTDYLNFTAALTSKPFEGFTKKLRAAMAKTGDHTLLDLCSGGGGPLPQVIRLLREKENLAAQALMTDFYPNLTAFKRIQRTNPHVNYLEKPVDATSVPKNLSGFRTLMNSFHHFKPEMAKKILEDAAKSKRGIAVLELVSRSFFGFFSVLTALLAIPLFTPFIRPFRFSRLFLTYIIPAVPFFALWDGIVSCFRIYSPQELQKLTESIQAEDYTWEIGRIPIEPAGFVTYLVGYPTSNGISQTRIPEKSHSTQ